jgi:hypothetical protein
MHTGMSYALLTTLSNIAGTAAGNISTLLADLWDVSNSTITGKDYEGVWKLSLLTSLLQPVGLLLVFLLPRNNEEMKTMQKSDHRNRWGGAALLIFIAGAWLWTMVETIVVLGK